MQSAIYNKIGIDYNSTRRADPYIAGRLYVLLEPQPGKSYLDIGCGTGNYTIALTEMDVHFTGIDPSEEMLEKAKGKSSKVQWLYGSAESISLPHCSMYGAIATLTIHHWPNLKAAFIELARVMKTGAKFVIFTFLPEQEHGYWLGHYFPELMSRSKAVPLQRIENAASEAGFTIAATEKYFVQEDLQDMFFYSGKHNPEIYFDPNFRKGMSIFAELRNHDEVDRGLQQLRMDINSGHFEEVRKQYDNDGGDYMFIVLKKDIAQPLSKEHST